MHKIVRWPGLFVFLLFIGLLVGGLLVSASTLVKRAIEATGTGIVGAKVEVGQVDLSLAPLGFHVFDLQVTDPDAPMVNAFQIDDIEFFLDTEQLLHLKTIVHEMQIKRLRVKVPRKESGAILQPVAPANGDAPTSEQGQSIYEFPSLEEFKVEDIFNREKLDSVEHLNRLRVVTAQDRELWNDKLAGLPNGKKVNHYREVLANLNFNSTGDVAADAAALQTMADDARKVQGEVRTDFENLDAARRDAQTMLHDMRTSFKRFAALPAQDVARIQAKYSLSPTGLANVSDLLFGEKVRYWVSMALDWYVKLKPIYERFEKNQAVVEAPERSSGVYVRYPEHGKYPDFLVHRASISMELSVGKINGELRNLTSDQSVEGHPLTFNLFSKEMQGVQDIEIVGILNHVDPGKSTDSVSVKARSIQAREINVLKNAQFPLRLAAAEMDLESAVELIGTNIGSKMNVAFRNTNFSVPFKDKPSRIAAAMAESLAGIKTFDAQVTLSGTLSDFGLSIKSNVDDVLKKAIGEQVAQAAQDFKHRVQQELDKRIAEPMANLQQEMAHAEEIGNAVERKIAELKTLRDQAEQRVKDLDNTYQAKLTEQKQQLQRNVDTKVDQEKSAAQEKAKAKQRKLQDEFKDKLKR